MSIYATQWILKFPRFGDVYTGCEWVGVIGQGVPAHIGTPGYGYEAGDPYAAFLPPAIRMREDDDDGLLRAMVVVREGTEKVGQEYVVPLLVLSGAEYTTISFHELHDRICDALRGSRPRVIAEAFDAGGESRLIFEEGPASRRDDE
jgi:hypothetical protein